MFSLEWHACSFLKNTWWRKKYIDSHSCKVIINGRLRSPNQVYSIYSRGVVNSITKSVILSLTRSFHIVCTFGYLNIAYWSHEIWKQHSQFITNNRFRSCPEFLIKTADYRNTKWQLTTRKRSFPISEQLAVHQHPFPPLMKAQTYTFQTLHGSTLTVFSYLFWHITVCVGQHSASL